MTIYKTKDLILAAKAKRDGANYALRIILEARKHPEIPVSLAFALIEQESGFKNIFGHDGVHNPAKKGGSVTKKTYAAYKVWRKQNLGMQGVGPGQLTWFELQDEADRRGGCWKPRYNIEVSIEHLAALIRQNGLVDGIAQYNGSGLAATAYSVSVRNKARRWHKVLA